MASSGCVHRDRGVIRAAAALLLFLPVAIAASGAQPKYRTFNQSDLGLKKAKAGKVTGSTVTFTLTNPRVSAVYGFHAIVSAKVLAIVDSGGFTSFHIEDKRAVDAVGPPIGGGDSVTVTFLVSSRTPGTVLNYFWWTDAAGGRRTHTQIKVKPVFDEQHYIPPNGGNVREFIYKRVVTKPDGLVLGIVAPDQGMGWVRNMSANGKYFPHTGPPRCLDYIVSSSGRPRPIVRQMRNLSTKKHNNHLLGELHALKIAILANDAGISEPTVSTATRFGDLIYNDPGNASDPFNGLTIREAAHLVDSALTYCANFDPAVYAQFDSGLARINAKFDGPYSVVSYDPFVLAGSAVLTDALFLHPNPDPPPARIEVEDRSILDETPSAWGLEQNYPNPFNPATSIEFSLAEPGIVTLTVHDLLGRTVAAPVDAEEYDDGAHLVNFEAEGLTSGLYFYRLTVRGTGGSGLAYSEIRKMVFLR